MKFVQYSAAKHNGITYDTMKDHVLEIVKKTYKYGGDILLAMDDIKYDAENELCTKTCGDIPQQKKKEETTDYDVAEYIEIKKERRERWKTYLNNKIKMCGLISSLCSNQMKRRLEEHPDYDTFKNNPFELLKEIKKKMYEPGRTKYPFHILSDQAERLFTMKQDDGEAIDDYYKRYKQICDNTKGSLGTSFLSDFAKNTREYQELRTLTEKQEFIKDSVPKWLAYILIKNADQ